jgi:hypothetical protein
MLGFETIVKGIIAITALFVIITIATNLFPDAMKDFFNATNLDKVTGVGKETYESDFEVPENMQENAELIKKVIEEMSSDNYEHKKPIREITLFDQPLVDLSGHEDIENLNDELKKFEGSNLVLIKDDERKSDIMYISLSKQIDYLEPVDYTPCIIKARDKGGRNSGLEFTDKEFVDKILFVDANHFKANGNKYILKGLTKDEDGDICFVR